MVKQQVRQNLENNSDEIDFSKFFGILLDGRWIVISITILFSIIGLIIALLSSPIYKSDALIQIEKKKFWWCVSNGGGYG